ncbi:Bacterial extracellular solute-binding protein [compost metagenome]
MFDKYGIQHPVNGMTWSEVYKLAEQFPNTGDDQQRQYGYVANYYEHVFLNQILRIGITEGRTYINPHTLQLSIDTQEWRDIGEVVLSALDKGAVNTEPEEGIAVSGLPPIVTGQTAMELGSFGTAFQFKQLEEAYSLEPVDWGVVTVPVDPAAPTHTDSYEVDQIIGIHKASEHKEEAWAFIKFITTSKDYYEASGEELRKFGIPVKTELVPILDGKDLSPFYTLNGKRQINNPYDKVDGTIIQAFKEAAEPILDKVLRGELTLEGAFSRMQEEGQTAVNLAKEKLEE